MAGDEGFLSRWSRRKSEARAEPASVPAAPAAEASRPAEGTGPATPNEPAAPLPPVDSLTPDSDFAPFMAGDVDADLRRQALKTLFRDPRFNVMDMMDVYVDDFSKPDPLPVSWLDRLEQVSRLGDRAGRDREEAERRQHESGAAAGSEAAGNAPALPDTPQPVVVDDAPAAPDVPPAGTAAPDEGGGHTLNSLTQSEVNGTDLPRSCDPK